MRNLLSRRDFYTRSYPFHFHRVSFYACDYDEHMEEGISDAKKYERSIRLY